MTRVPKRPSWLWSVGRLVFLGDTIRENTAESLYNVGRKLLACQIFDLLECLFRRTTRSVGAIGCHRVVGVGYTHDLRPQGDPFSLQTVRITAAVRKVWPENLPLFVRISCTDWVENGWDLSQSIDLAGRLKALGVDFIDCSSGGTAPDAQIPAGPGFQAVFAEAVRKDVGIETGAVGLITSPAQAEQVLVTGQADAILLGREFLRSPYWPLTAAADLGVDLEWPDQYKRAKPACVPE